MAEAVFLSAGVPDPKRGPEYARTTDAVAIQAAVSALLYVTLGRRKLIWGGQPAITPIIWVVAADLGVDYGEWVHLYQSRHFEQDFPEENARFQNVTFSDDAGGDRDKSLQLMRERMFSENEFSSAVFIGGMRGIIDEFAMFSNAQPCAEVVPVASTGGATLDVAKLSGRSEADLWLNLDYVSLFHKMLHISVKERRYPRMKDQPEKIEQRLQ